MYIFIMYTFTNPKLGEIHFKNGYIKLITQTFHKRKRTDFMTYCIWRDYKQSPQLKRQKIENIINQIVFWNHLQMGYQEHQINHSIIYFY